MIKTAVVIVPILYMDEPKVNHNQDVNLQALLESGYRVKSVNDFEYHDVMFAHYVLEKDE